jgi:hypothetical protein
MKQLFCLTLFLLLAAPCVVWSDASNADAAKITAAAAPVVDNVYEAMKAHDFGRMRKDFDDKLAKAVSKDQLAEGVAGAEKASGAIAGKSFDEMAKKDGFIDLSYTLKMSKGPDWTLRFTFVEGDPAWKIRGLWLGPRALGVRAASAAEAEAILKAAKPVIDNYLAACKAKDYAGMERDFSAKLRKGLPPDKLKETTEKIIDVEQGAFVSAVFDRIEADSVRNFVYYRLNRTKMPVSLKFEFAKDDPKCKITGLWEKPWTRAVNPAPTAEAEAIVEAAKPVIDNYFAAYKAHDYAGMEKDFTAAMRNGLPPEKFKASMEKQVEPEFGAFVSAEFDSVETERGLDIVYYRVYRTKLPSVVKFVFEKDDPAHKITGLWENPL